MDDASSATSIQYDDDEKEEEDSIEDMDKSQLRASSPTSSPHPGATAVPPMTLPTSLSPPSPTSSAPVTLPSPSAAPPNSTFFADSTSLLSRGITAYKLLQPPKSQPGAVRTIVLLHGLTSSSAMWEQLAPLLSTTLGARVLVLDFYGHGRSPWSGFPCTLDTYVTQVKELLDGLYLSLFPVDIIGFCLGGAVAVGFSVKFPHLCASLVLIDTAGVRMKNPAKFNLLKKKVIGEVIMMRRKGKMAQLVEVQEFYDRSTHSKHRSLIDQHLSLVEWQVRHSRGYVGALLSTYRYFPLSGLHDLFAVSGKRLQRPVLILWGEEDNLFPLRKALSTMQESCPSGNIISFASCGHNPLIEQFDDTSTCILEFFQSGGNMKTYGPSAGPPSVSSSRSSNP